MIWKHNIGRKGEEIALSYLKKKGYFLVDKNYRKKWGEIDLIVRREESLVFVEVKTMSKSLDVTHETNDYFMPEDHIFPDKLKRIGRTINSFLLERGISEDVDYQIDVVSVILDKKTLKPIKIEHLENVF